MRNPILTIAIASVLAAPCTAFAGGKKDTIEVLSPSFGSTNHGGSSNISAGSGRVEHTYIKQNPDGPKTLNAVGGSTGPTKPPLPTTVPTTGIRHQ